MKLKGKTEYIHADNKLYVKTIGKTKVIICSKESKKEQVIKRMTTSKCLLESYEEWDEGDDMKWILTFRVLDDYELKPNLN